MEIWRIGRGRRQSQILALPMMFADAKQIGLPDLTGLRTATEGGERDGHHDSPDLLGAIDLADCPHSALPLPVVAQLLAVDLQIAPLPGGRDFELLINLV